MGNLERSAQFNKALVKPSQCLTKSIEGLLESKLRKLIVCEWNMLSNNFEDGANAA